MKRSSIVSLCLLVAAAIGLTVLFIVLKQEEKKPQEPEKVKFFTVTEIDVKRVNRIALRSNVYEAEFRGEGEIWYHETDLLNQISVSMILNLLSNLRAIAKVEDPASEEEYGLDAPASVLEAYDGETRLVRIELGDRVPTKDYYYARFNDEKTVYTVSSGYTNVLMKDRSYFARAVKMPSIAGIKYIEEVSLSGDLFPGFRAVKDANSRYSYAGGVMSWHFEEPYQSRWEADVINGSWGDQLEFYLNIRPEETVTVRPDQFAEYGLSRPAASLTVRYTNEAQTEHNSYTLHIGSQNPDTGAYYARIEGLDVLLVLSRAKVELMCKVDVFNCTYRSLFYPNVQVFRSITVSAGEITHVFTHKNEDGTDRYFLDGEELDSGGALAWAQQLIALKATAFDPSEIPDAEPILTIAVEVEDSEKFGNMTARIYRGDNGSDIIERLGVCDCTIDSRAVDDFINTMTTY